MRWSSAALKLIVEADDFIRLFHAVWRHGSGLGVKFAYDPTLRRIASALRLRDNGWFFHATLDGLMSLPEGELQA
jgi:hypothetical protein